VAEKKEARNIGLQVEAPKESCTDKHCPFHGTLPVRGHIIKGVVVSDKMQGSIQIKRTYMHYIPKFERYEKRTAKYMAHCPPCLKVGIGDTVTIAECRPISKTISFVAIQKS
jgi:small subunit ribosomal protein S17